jgi:hypothetical protein
MDSSEQPDIIIEERAKNKRLITRVISPINRPV